MVSVISMYWMVIIVLSTAILFMTISYFAYTMLSREAPITCWTCNKEIKSKKKIHKKLEKMAEEYDRKRKEKKMLALQKK